MEKVVCKTHRFAYIKEKGCPFCEKERLERMYKKYSKQTKEDTTNKNIILKLKEHFNAKKN